MTTSSGDAPGQGDPGQGDDERQAQRRERARQRRRVDEVFGTVLPSVTDDERDPGERSGFSAEHYRSSRPPHHGGQS